MLARSFIKSGNIVPSALSDYSIRLLQDSGTGKITTLKLIENIATPGTPFTPLNGIVLDIFIDGNPNPISFAYANEQLEVNVAFASSIEVCLRTTEGATSLNLNYFIAYTKIIQPAANEATFTSQALTPIPDYSVDTAQFLGKRTGLAAYHDEASHQVYITNGKNEQNMPTYNLLTYSIDTDSWTNNYLWNIPVEAPPQPQPWVNSWITKTNNYLLTYSPNLYLYDLTQQAFALPPLSQSYLLLTNYNVVDNTIDDFKPKNVKVCCTVFTTDPAYSADLFGGQPAQLYLIKTSSDIYAQIYTIHSGTWEVLAAANLSPNNGIYSGDIAFHDETYTLKGSLQIEVFDPTNQLALNDKIDRMELSLTNVNQGFQLNKITASSPHTYNNKTYILNNGDFDCYAQGTMTGATLIAYNHTLSQFEAVMPVTRQEILFPKLPTNLKISDYVAVHSAGNMQASMSLASFILPQYTMCGENEKIYIITSSGISMFDIDTKTFTATLPGSEYSYGHGTYTAAKNGKIYIVNGYDRQRGLLQQVLVYDTATNTLVNKTDAYISLPPRSAHGFATISGNDMYLFGGVSNGVTNNAWKVALPIEVA